MTELMYNSDCLDGLRGLEKESIDLVFTDPPYGINKEGIANDDSLEVYYNSLPLLYDVLKPDRFFVTFASIGNMPGFFANNPFKYRWQYVVYVNNGMVRGSLGFNRFMSVLVFQKGNAKLSKQLADVYEFSTSAQECAKRVHPTEKNLKVCRKIIEAFSKPGDLVLDPFMGSGTTALACKQLKRNFVGFEIKPTYYNSAKNRISYTELLSFGGLR